MCGRTQLLSAQAQLEVSPVSTWRVHSRFHYIAELSLAHRTKNLIHTLMFYAINTGAITMSVSGESFVRMLRADRVISQGLVSGYSIHGTPSSAVSDRASVC